MTNLRIPDPAQRADLAVFAERALRGDPAAVIRLRRRPDGLVAAWVATGLGVLACRAVAASIDPQDVTHGADALHRGLSAEISGPVQTGLPMDSAWRGALPPEAGFVRVDDVPAGLAAGLARRGAELARENGSAHRPPASLLDQQVLEVSGAGVSVAVPMRALLGLAAMGFLPGSAGEDEVIRIRATPAWLRIDARFGSVFGRRGAQPPQNVELTIESAAISR